MLCSLAFSSELNANNVERTGQLLAECGMRITERIGGRLPSTPRPEQCWTRDQGVVSFSAST